MPPPPPIAAAALRRRLLAWYRRAARPLPWRAAPRAGDAYCVWISEIMLQQTRVQAAIPYYERFLARFPRLADLAGAEEAEVLALWSGLGYYRRARQLLAAARLAAERHGGALPMEEAALRRLPGIGVYTAGAILSIAGGQPLPAVDGNARRIASRLAGAPLAPAAAQARLAGWVDPRRPGAFNQALMDLGAAICLPRAPRCAACPLQELCATRGELPASAPRARPIHCEEHYGLAMRRGRVWLRRRPEGAAQLPGMWELPATAAAARVPLGAVRHAITTRAIRAFVYADHDAGGEGKWMNRGEAAAAPLTGLARKILRRFAGWDLA